MSSFITPLVVSPMPDGRRWRLVFPFRYHVGSRYSRDVIAVPIGFETDFASIPKFLWFLPYWAKYCKPSIIHDWLYKVKQIMGKPITRKKADLVFYEGLLIAWRNHKSGPIMAVVEYWAVRLFGWPAWRRFRPPQRPVAKVRTCKTCGCTDDKPCITDEGPCRWVTNDLCSACIDKDE